MQNSYLSTASFFTKRNMFCHSFTCFRWIFKQLFSYAPNIRDIISCLCMKTEFPSLIFIESKLYAVVCTTNQQMQAGVIKSRCAAECLATACCSYSVANEVCTLLDCSDDEFTIESLPGPSFMAIESKQLFFSQ